MENKDKVLKATEAVEETEATNEAEETKGTGELHLRKPTMIDGELVDKIAYDLEDLDGDDVSLAIKELGKRGVMVTMAETDQNYHAMIFSIAAGLAYEDVKRLKIKDFNKACNIVRNFFLD